MLIVGIDGLTLTAEAQALLADPRVSGVILFRRNFASRTQVAELCAALRGQRPELLICVDQEGGPVQRFRAGFTELPPLSALGALDQEDPGAAEHLAYEHGWLMAAELKAVGVDLSLAPVVDLKLGNRAIGERAFAAEPARVARLAERLIAGMAKAGMAAVLKHFPGHGSVLADTHHEVAIDPRTLADISATDLQPFSRLLGLPSVAAVMLAHVTYPAVDALPAGYSPRWIGLLREQFGYGGCIMSDDIAMAAAEGAGGLVQRVRAHLQAGCDRVLVCKPDQVAPVLAGLDVEPAPQDRHQAALRGHTGLCWHELTAARHWQDSQAALVALARVAQGHPTA